MPKKPKHTKCEAEGCKKKTRHGYRYNPNPVKAKAAIWYCEECYADAIRRDARATSVPHGVRCQVA